MIKRNYHVIPHTKAGWAVKKAGNTRVSETFDTQKKAIEFAKKNAKRNSSELFIHGKTGRIRERNTYGRDKYPPKG